MKRFILLVCTLLLFRVGVRAGDPPKIDHYVNDYAGALKEDDKAKLESKLQTYHDSTSTQIVILIVKSLDGESIEQFSMRVAEQAKIGTKGKDNGVLVTLALESHDWRIENGYGVEGVLTDAKTDYIGRHVLVPPLKDKEPDIAGALDATTNAIIQTLSGQYEAVVQKQNESEQFSLLWKVLLGIACVIGLVGSGMDSKLPMGFAGMIFFPLAYFLICGLASMVYLIALLPIGFIVGLVAAFINPLSFVTGGGSGGSSGGGFSGGGGGFGGGGSSGKW